MRGAIFALALAFLARPAAAFVLDDDGNGHPLHWNTDDLPISYVLVAKNNPVGPAGEAAIHAAFHHWSESSPALLYRFDGYVSEGAQRFDHENQVFWKYDSWPYDGALAAITFRYFDTSDGHLLDADIVFNGAEYRWSVGGEGYDIENSATHEVGHFNGLGHSLDVGATMYSSTKTGETSKRALVADDVAGLDAIYGADQDVVKRAGAVTSSASGVRGRSASARPGAAGVLATAALCLSWLVPRRRRALRRL